MAAAVWICEDARIPLFLLSAQRTDRARGPLPSTLASIHELYRSENYIMLLIALKNHKEHPGSPVDADKQLKVC